MQNFGERLRALRIAAGLTQLQLADKVEASESTIKGYERRPEPPKDSKFLADLEYVLGAPLVDVEVRRSLDDRMNVLAERIADLGEVVEGTLAARLDAIERRLDAAGAADPALSQASPWQLIMALAGRVAADADGPDAGHVIGIAGVQSTSAADRADHSG